MYHSPAVAAKPVKGPSGWLLLGESEIGVNSARSFSTMYGGEKRLLFMLGIIPDNFLHVGFSRKKTKQKINKMRLL